MGDGVAGGQDGGAQWSAPRSMGGEGVQHLCNAQLLVSMPPSRQEVRQTTARAFDEPCSGTGKEWHMSRRNIVRQLLQRETRGGRAVCCGRVRCYRLQDVAGVEDQAVVLGFSSDGHFLIYCTSWEQELHVYWREFEPSFGRAVSNTIASRVVVGPMASRTQEFDGSLELHVWQCSQAHLVVAMGMPPRGLCAHVTISPDPLRCFTPSLSSIVSLRFFISTGQSTAARVWRLVPRENNRNQLLLHLGTSVVVLGLIQTTRRHGRPHLSSPPRAPLCTAWYHPSEFILDIENSTQITPFPHGPNTLAIQCEYQYTFEIEKLLRACLDSFPKLQHFTFSDYEIQFLHTLEDGQVFMCGVVDLQAFEFSREPPPRIAICFSWTTHTGRYKVIRLVQIPLKCTLHAAAESAREHFLHTVQRFVVIPPALPYWTNSNVLNGSSLTQLVNPVFPAIIQC